MKGSIRRRGPSSWQVRVYLGRGPDGKRRYGNHGVQGTKRDAERKLAALLHGVHSGSYVEHTRVTLGEYLNAWLDGYARSHVAPTTFERYQQIVEQHLVPALGHLALPKVSPAAIKAYYAEAQQSGRKAGKGGLSSTTVLQHHRVLREALQHAVHENLLAVNPAGRVRPPKRQRREMRALDEHQALALIEHARETRLYVPVLLATLTGMRRGEILAVRWSDVDLEASTLTVRRSLEETRAGLRFKEPKSRSAIRTLDLPPLLVDALRSHRAQQAKQRLALGRVWHDEQLVCPAADGSPWRPNSLTPAFRMLIRRLDLPCVRFHDLRHTHASLLLRQGVHPKIVSERLGHSGVGITLDTYTHLLPGMQREAADRLNASFLEAMNQRNLGRDGQGMAKTADGDETL
jgi:integrase